MKICLVTNTLDPGTGLGRMVSNIARELESRGNEVGFILGSGTSQNKFIHIDFSVHLSSPVALIKKLYAVRRFVADYDYIICYDVRPAGTIATVASVGTKNKIIVHSLGTYSLFPKKGDIKKSLIRWVYERAYRVLLINEFVEKKIVESNPGFCFTANKRYVSVGVEIENFFRKPAGAPLVSGAYMISVGALKVRKGQLEVLKALKEAQKTHKNLRYVVVGSTKDSPSYYEEMKAFIEQENLTEWVIFIEDVTDDELINLYTYSKFFILTPTSTESSIEGFGMVYIESALCGKTSIGTLDSGAEAAIVHMQTGLLVPNNVADIAGAIRELLENVSLRTRLEEYACTRATSFDWKNVVDLYENKLK